SRRTTRAAAELATPRAERRADARPVLARSQRRAAYFWPSRIPNVSQAPMPRAHTSTTVVPTAPRAAVSASAAHWPAAPASPARSSCSAASTLTSSMLTPSSCPIGSGTRTSRAQPTSSSNGGTMNAVRPSSASKAECNGAAMNPSAGKKITTAEKPAMPIVSAASPSASRGACTSPAGVFIALLRQLQLVRQRARCARCASSQDRRTLLRRLLKQWRDLAEVVGVDAPHLHGRRAQDRRRVVHGEAGDAIPLASPPVQLAHRAGAEETGHRVAPQGHDQLRIEDRDLPLRIRVAARQLVGQWVAIGRGPTADDVGDEDVVPA